MTSGGVISEAAEERDEDEICAGEEVTDAGSPIEVTNVVMLDGAEVVQSMIDVTVIAPDMAPSDSIVPAAPGAQTSPAGGTISQEFPSPSGELC